MMGFLDFFKPKKQENSYSIGDGGSVENAVMINTSGSQDGIAAEIDFITKNFGKKNEDWTLESQSAIHLDGKYYDLLTVKLKDGQIRSFYFDITKFYCEILNMENGGKQ